MTEEWRIISDFPDYAVSNLGQVKRITPKSNGARNMRVLKCILTMHGYHQVNLWRDGVSRCCFVHRIVCEAFHGPRPDGKLHVAHGDGSPLNNRADNLRWASSLENEADKRIHGTVACGERGGNSRLTEMQVRAIRADSRPQRKIAADYGVTQANVSYLKLGKSWRHVA